MTKTRLEAFSDGVIAIIITIMVLELKTPHGTNWDAIKPLIPVLFSYLISFIMIGIYWGNHHHLLHTIKSVNSKMIWANLHLLFWLSLIPFATAWMGENNFDPITVALYSVLLNLSGLSYYILLKVITKSQSYNSKLAKPLQYQSKKGLISLICYTTATFAAFIHPAISGFIVLGVAIMWWIPDKNIEKSLQDNN